MFPTGASRSQSTSSESGYVVVRSKKLDPFQLTNQRAAFSYPIKNQNGG
jgi:hypothetical protein